MKVTKNELQDLLEIKITKKEYDEFLYEIDNSFDFLIVFKEREYRFINDYYIDKIYHEEQVELITDCYFVDANLPWWIKIDWEKTIKNVLDSDGYGNHFSSYDGSEDEITNNGNLFYIFRIN